MSIFYMLCQKVDSAILILMSSLMFLYLITSQSL